MPESKRYAESDAERTEILDRHHAVLDALGAAATEDVICIVARWGSSESAIDDDPDLEQAHPGAWLWTSVRLDDEGHVVADGELPSERYESWCHLFATEGPLHKWDDVLRLVADDRASGVMILPRDLAWIYHPYDGGADVIAPTTDERDKLRDQFAPWLPHRSDGL